MESLVTTLDQAFSAENCPKKNYLHLISCIMSSGVHSPEIAEIFAKHFNKFQFRYGFHYEEIGKLSLYFNKFNYKRICKVLLQKLGDLFNQEVGSETFKAVLKTQLLRVTKVAQKITSYDSQKLNDLLGKHISKSFLENNSLEENLAFLRHITKLNFKPVSIDKVEQAVVLELLSK